MLSLRELKLYLMDVQVVSLFELANRFNVEPDIVRARISHFIRKGQVRKLLKTSKCGTQCAKCNPLITELYEWVLSS